MRVDQRILAAKLLESSREDLGNLTTMTTYRFLRASDELVEAACEMLKNNDVARLAQAIEEYRSVRLLMRGIKLRSRRARDG